MRPKNILKNLPGGDALNILHNLRLNFSKNSGRIHIEFSKLNNHANRVKCIIMLLERFNLEFPGKKLQLEDEPVVEHKYKSKKSAATAKFLLEEGKQYFDKEDYLGALQCYNEALCFAPIDSDELKLGYEKRAVVYFNSGLYQFCLDNIALAVKNGYIMTAELSEIQSKAEKRIKENPLTAVASLPDINQNRTRYMEVNGSVKVVATIDRTPGDLIIMENPLYAAVTDMAAIYYRCTNCMSHNHLNLMPCNISTRAMFCSDNCKTTAWKRFYKFECPVIEGLFKYCTKYSYPAVRFTLKALTLFDDMEQFKTRLEKINEEKSPSDLNDDDDEATRFLTFYKTLTTKSMESRNLIDNAALCAIALGVLKNSFCFIALNNDDLFCEIMMTMMEAPLGNVEDIFTSDTVNKPLISHPNYPLMDNGSTISLVCSLFGHSCYPNIVRVVEGKKTAIMVIREIQAGEELVENYQQLQSESTKLRINCSCNLAIPGKLSTDEETEEPETTSVNLSPEEREKHVKELDDLARNFHGPKRAETESRIMELFGTISASLSPLDDFMIVVDLLKKYSQLMYYKTPLDFIVRPIE